MTHKSLAIYRIYNELFGDDFTDTTATLFLHSLNFCDLPEELYEEITEFCIDKFNVEIEKGGRRMYLFFKSGTENKENLMRLKSGEIKCDITESAEDEDPLATFA